MTDRLAYGVEGAAKILGISGDDVRAIIEQGHLLSFSIVPRGKMLIPAGDLDEFRRAKTTLAAILECRESPTEQRRRALAVPTVTSGVYILFLAGLPVYVGLSRTLAKRLQAHVLSGRRFDAYEVIPCDQERAVWLERELIRTLKPTQNLVRYARHTAATGKTIPKVRLG
jgi:hypothetical protein